MSLKENFELFELQKGEVTTWYAEEIAGIRTGRVTPNLVANVNVDHYGTKTPVSGLASVNNSDARTLVITPWDKGVIQPIEKALTEADLGVMPSVDGEVIRIVFPSMTEESREQTTKQLHKKTEEARVRLRQARDEALREIKIEKDKGDLTEDDFYEGKKTLDEMIEKANKSLEEVTTKKEEEIQAI
jgi:ribosome recycling factor